MNRRIAIFTTTRAEFGLFVPLLREIEKTNGIEYHLFVGGTHLSDKYGKTIDEIKNKGFTIKEVFDYIPDEDTSFALSKSLGTETILLSNIFKNHDFDFVLILGDRYELLPIVQTAILFKKPIVHLYGGEKTEGALDEQIRHMISKAAHLHFVSCNEYVKNLMILGENSWRIFNIGSLATDNMMTRLNISKKNIFEKFSLDINEPFVLLTYHPVTLEFNIKPAQQILNIFNALKSFNFQVIITAPNIDDSREEIINIINEEVDKNKKYHFIKSLGTDFFHELLSHCEFILGNSSSGIVEAPFFKIPTINIGDRQKGRLRHSSIIDTGYEVRDIIIAIEKALSKSFHDSISDMKYKFGDGNSARRIVEVLLKTEVNEKLFRKSLESKK